MSDNSGITPADVSLTLHVSSVPRNIRLAEVLWFAHYVEKVGTGTLDVIAGCQRADLPEPGFQQSGDEFVVTLWRDWLTEDVLAGVELNARQRAAIEWIKRNGRITNTEYRRLIGASDRSASRDLSELTAAGLLERVGMTGRAASYVIAVQTRRNPAKPATEPDEKTRRKPAKPASPETGRRRAKRAKPARKPRLKSAKPVTPRATKGLTEGSKGSAGAKKKGRRR